MLASNADGSGWKTLTYQQYYDSVTRAAKSFIKVGTQPSRSLLFMPPPAYIGEGGNMQSDGDVCGSVGDSVLDNLCISETAEATDA